MPLTIGISQQLLFTLTIIYSENDVKETFSKTQKKQQS